MIRSIILFILLLFVIKNTFCQDTISIRLSLNENYQVINKISSVSILYENKEVPYHLLNDSILVIDEFINRQTNEIALEICINGYFLKIVNLPKYIFKSGRWNIDFDFFPFSSDNQFEARSDIDNTNNVIVVLNYTSNKKYTEGVDFIIFQKKRDVLCKTYKRKKYFGVKK